MPIDGSLFTRGNCAIPVLLKLIALFSSDLTCAFTKQIPHSHCNLVVTLPLTVIKRITCLLMCTRASKKYRNSAMELSNNPSSMFFLSLSLLLIKGTQSFKIRLCLSFDKRF